MWCSTTAWLRPLEEGPPVPVRERDRLREPSARPAGVRAAPAGLSGAESQRRGAYPNASRQANYRILGHHRISSTTLSRRCRGSRPVPNLLDSLRVFSSSVPHKVFGDGDLADCLVIW
jgi:hypothetical protein